MLSLLICLVTLAEAEPADEAAKPTAAEAAKAPEPDTSFVTDRVRSVSDRVFKKKGRVALWGNGAVSINDAFFTKAGGTLGATWYPKERLGFGVHGSAFATVTDEDTRIARANFQSVPLVAHPVWSALAHVEWSPLYGKLKAGDTILYLDAFIVGGLGAVGVPRPGFAFELGGGGRLALSERFAVYLTVTNATYTAPPGGSQLGLLQNLTLFNLGVSFFVGGGAS